MIKTLKISLSLFALFASSLLAGCNTRLPGQPVEAERWRAPAEITDFSQLYAKNCAGCHGVGGRLGAARSLNDPLYLSFVSDNVLRQVISQGRKNTNMPAFAQGSGGALTDQQIGLLITGMRAQWSKPDGSGGIELPRYSVTDSSPNTANIGNSARGAAAYQTYCASCHGPNGAGGSAGSIVDPNFLNLVSDQGLRTTVVVGRADLGKPDWRSNVPGHPMSAQEIDDVVVWLAEQRQRADVTARSNRNEPNENR